MLNRETKVGLVVVGSFLVLVVVVIASRLRDGGGHMGANEPPDPEGTAPAAAATEPAPTIPWLQRPPDSPGIQLAQARETPASTVAERGHSEMPLPPPEPPAFPVPAPTPAPEASPVPSPENAAGELQSFVGPPAPEFKAEEQPGVPMVLPPTLPAGQRQADFEKATATEPGPPLPPVIAPPTIGADIVPPPGTARNPGPPAASEQAMPGTKAGPTRTDASDPLAPPTEAPKERTEAATPPVAPPPETVPPGAATSTAAEPPAGVPDRTTAEGRSPSALSRVESWDEEVHVWKPNDTFRSVSQAFYQTDAYVRALFEFNRAHPQGAQGLHESPPVMRPGEKIFLPEARILLKEYPTLVRSAAAAPPAEAFPVSQDNPATYRVRPGGEMFLDIARRLQCRWEDIYLLNKQHDPKQPIPAGTLLHLPPNAKAPQTEGPDR